MAKYDDCELCHGQLWLISAGQNNFSPEYKEKECPLCAMRARAENAESDNRRYALFARCTLRDLLGDGGSNAVSGDDQ